MNSSAPSHIASTPPWHALALTLACGLALAIGSCGTPAGAARTDAAASKLTSDEVLALIDKIERDPLSDGATNIRPRVFEWVISHPSMFGIQAHGRYLRKLEESEHRMGGELLLQFIFGIAAWRLTTETGVVSREEEVEAGLRSVVASYRVMLAHDSSLRLAFLDDLSEISRRGQLSEYIAKVDEIESGQIEGGQTEGGE